MHVARLTLKAFALERYSPPIVALLSNDHHAPQRGGRFLCATNPVVISDAAGGYDMTGSAGS